MVCRLRDQGSGGRHHTNPRGSPCLTPPEKGHAMSTYVYRHATRRQYLASILAEGLDPARATATPLLLWLHTPERTPWAVLHVVRRHGVALADVILLDVQVPRQWLQRAERGLWTCDRVIAPARLRVGASGYDVAASPISDA